MTEIYGQRRNFKENGNEKDTYTQNEKQKDDISHTYNEERYF